MRKRLDLNGIWYFLKDPKNQGEKCEWYLNWPQDCMQVTVPHIWQREGQELTRYAGTAWYMRKFSVDSIQQGSKIFLNFNAVDYQARIWVNGQYVGEHEGGFTPFEFDVTDYIWVNKPNILVVRVYDPQDNAEIPIGKQGSWYTRVSGIWQDAYLEERAGLFVKRVFVTPNIEDQEAEVKVCYQGKLDGKAQLKYIVRNHLGDKQPLVWGEHPVAGYEITLKIKIPNVILWEPENPHLYEIEIKTEGWAGTDEYVEIFGMRQVSYKDGKVYLNRKPLYLRGALDQGFYPDTIYTAPSDEYIQNEICLAKAAGFNLLRKHIKIEVPRYLYWADRMGMLIWSEPPNYVKWTAQGRKRFYNELRSMIKRDYNHPSIIIWSIYNEEWGLEWDLANDKKKQEHVKQLYDQVRQMDKTRLICDNSGWRHVKTDINDYHRYFVCPDQIEAWKRDLDEFIIGSPDSNFVDGYHAGQAPIIVSEFGVWGLPSVDKVKEHYHGEPWWFVNQGEETHQEDFKNPLTARGNFKKYGLNKIFGSFENLAFASQKRMHRAVKSIIEEMRKRPQVAGYVVTEFTDIEWETNGWLDYLRNPKEGFYQFKNFNGELVMMVDAIKHNMWAGESQVLDLIISNHGLKSFDGVVKWFISGTDLEGEIPVRARGEDFIKLPDAISFKVPANIKTGFYHLHLTMLVGTEVYAENTEELTISKKVLAKPVDVLAYQMKDDFIKQLKVNGFKVWDSFEKASVVVTNCLDQKVLKFARDGGKVVFLAEEGDDLQDKGQYTFRQLPEGESWDRTSSFNFVNTKWFDGIPMHPEMGWEMEGVLPDYVVPFSDYRKTSGTSGRIIYMFGNEGLACSSEIISGYFQGWIGQVGGTLLHNKEGKGHVFLTTWHLIDNYGKHPIATQVLNQLIQW